MFDKTIKVWINKTPLTLTNQEVKDLLSERIDMDALERESYNLTRRLELANTECDNLTHRLELANAKLKDYGHASGF